MQRKMNHHLFAAGMRGACQTGAKTGMRQDRQGHRAGQGDGALTLGIPISEIVDNDRDLGRSRGNRYEESEYCSRPEGSTQTGADENVPDHSALLWTMRLFCFSVLRANSMSESYSGSARVGVITVRSPSSRWMEISGSIPRSWIETPEGV